LNGYFAIVTIFEELTKFNKMKKLIGAILSVLIALFFTACGGGGGNASSDSVAIPVTISTY